MQRAAWGWVAVLAVAACLGWLPFLGRSLSPDEGGFLVVAGQWSPGSSLYGDYWVDRPPLLIWIFEAADGLGGKVALRLLGTLAVVAAVVLAGLVGRLAAPGGRRGVLLPAAAAAVLAATPLFGGSVVNAEVLGLPFLLAGMAALVVAHTNQSRAVAWGAVGGAFGVLAFMVKQSLVDVFVMAGVLLLMRSRSARALAGFGVGVLVTTATTLALAAGRGTDPSQLWGALVVFRFDAAQVLAASRESVSGRFADLLLALLFSGAPLLVLALGWVAARRRSEPATGLVAPPDLRGPAYAVLACELVVVLLGGSYWLHYLLGLVPGVVLLAAAAAQRPPTAQRAVTGAYLFAAVSTASVIGWLGLHPIDRPEEPVIAYLGQHAEPGDTAVVAFGGANILTEVDLECPYPYLWSLPVRVRDPDLDELTAVLAGPERPTWLVVSYRSLDPWGLDFSEVQARLDADYTVTEDLGRFTVYRLADDG